LNHPTPCQASLPSTHPGLGLRRFGIPGPQPAGSARHGTAASRWQGCGCCCQAGKCGYISTWDLKSGMFDMQWNGRISVLISVNTGRCGQEEGA
jgi:hypothetical protein